MKIRTAVSWLAGVVLAFLVVAAVPSQSARALDFPNGPIRWIVPYPSGGSYDLLSRGLAPILSKEFGVPVVVNILPGPDGYNQLIKAKPDGQTIGMSEPLSVYATALLAKPGYNVEDLTWLGRINASANVIVASKKSGLTSFDQMVKRKTPIRGGAFGVTTPILQLILLSEATKFQLAPVNFRTISEMIIGTVRGDVDVALLGPTTWSKYIAAGDVIPLLVWDEKRDPTLPNVPSLAEFGLSELVVFMNHRGIVVPPNLPKPVQDRIGDGFRKVLDGEGKAYLEKVNFETNQMWGQEFFDVVAKLRESLNKAEPTIRKLATQ